MNLCCRGKAISIIYLSVCVLDYVRAPRSLGMLMPCVHVALLIQRATRMYHVVT